jgi:peptidoglycan hydrolase-like protein with peptidoglycan-binding domain
VAAVPLRLPESLATKTLVGEVGSSPTYRRMARRAQAGSQPARSGPIVTPAGRQRKAPGSASAVAVNSRADVLYLQATAGNAAVVDLLELQRQAAVLAPPAPPAPAAAAPAPAAPMPRTTTTGSHPLLKKGSQGPAVEELQTKLNLIPSAAPDRFLKVDGDFADKTDTAIRAFQSAVMHMGVPDGKVGSLTWGAIDASVVGAESAPRVHPVLHLNDSSAAVGEAQEKLNAAGAAPVLSIDGAFNAGMLASVKHFQHTAMGIATPSGEVDQPTWTALDHAAPGGGTRAARGGRSIEEHVGPAGGGDPLAAAKGSIHLVVGPANVTKGIAVKELQQKLNGFLASKGKAFMKAKGVKTLVDDGDFGTKTQKVLLIFQTESGLTPETGLGDAPTWTKLDAFASTVGSESREWKEIVGGQEYGLTSVYSWKLAPSAITVTVALHFTPPGPGLPMPAFPVGTWFSDIKKTWNQFKTAKKGDPTQVVDIAFNPIQSADAAAHTVAVKPGNGRSDAGTFFAGDPDIGETVSHEFGHMIGLKDEYQTSAADYRTETGYEAPVGQMTGPTSGKNPAQVAQLLQNAIVARALPSVTPSPARQAIAGMRQGAFSQRVLAAYQALPNVNVPAVVAVPQAPNNPGATASPAFATTNDLVKDLNKGLLNDAQDIIPTDKYETIEVLTYDSGSVMGDSSRQPDRHEHGAEPRHVREFAKIVQHVKGGVWEVAAR